jgi:D-sedoheptulose 7-phosphate isomerase
MEKTMDILDQIKMHFSESLETKARSAEILPEQIAKAARVMAACLILERKILCCGNGGSACDAEHFAGELLNRLEQERPALPAIVLNANMAAITAIANDYDYSDVFAKQIQALGKPRDVLLVISTSGDSANILRAVEVAREKQMSIIALTGNKGGKLASLLVGDNDIEIRVPATRTMRIQEVHALVIHCLCDLIDQQLFGEML